MDAAAVSRTEETLSNGNTAGAADVADIDGNNKINGGSISLPEAQLSSGNNITPSSPSLENGHPRKHSDSEAQSTARNFEREHGIFLRAIMDLLTERDQLAIAADVNGQIKSGSLRKASHRIKGLWKTKYVEIRRGTFSYFDDNGKQRNENNVAKLLRKDIPLRASSCTCRAVKIRSIKGAAFELKVGGSRRYWVANTKEERQSWIQAIHIAMADASVTRGDNFLEYQDLDESVSSTAKKKVTIPLDSPYKQFLEQYLKVRAATNSAESKDEYVHALTPLRGITITVPVQWIKSQLDDTAATVSFTETSMSSSIKQLWKDLLRDSVDINGETLLGESLHGPERILGKLTQQILSCDETVREKLKSDKDRTGITEAQAVSYARDILLATNRTRSGGDSYFCAENLCLNRALAVLVPSSTEANPLSIKVSDCPPKGGNTPDANNISGWVQARNGPDKPWKKLYLLLSHSILGCYAEGTLELRERIMLQGAKVGSNLTKETKDATQSQQNGSEERIITITTKDGQLVREYLFEDNFDFLLWDASFKKASSISGGSEAINGAKSPPSSTSSTPGVEITPTVHVVVNVCTEYKLCTLDPSGIEREDTWAELQTTFEQMFTLTGGPKGKISRGDEVVQLEVLGPCII
mmetsp:Transcript_40744/g.85591  ORF Transcript_40744/g.85591 Transcript_40744/m.85591 type:complete len:641 (-) Transcript_40744:64-1986(-)|eukprot:CAMPEP_0183740818 /NCGR_PEP_ID=MMETSP0737-20130205/60573_1 /TAXON_ID=385413 /ORGANISM="Thalassiosira miniscula, Strain CCMP1093" /LENGTH=640 /DNA_ID=CAMNT_0025975971 /DNA_START=121 /DNA_END=2043 /DNA_ORIENTATION=+